jgi:hypothetical protein
VVVVLAMALTGPPASEGVRYVVAPSPGAEVLAVEVFPGAARWLTIDPDLVSYVADMAVEVAPGRWTPVAARDGGWSLPAAGAHVRYHFLLGRAADTIGDVDVAARCRRALVAPPTTWLVRPSTERGRVAYQLRMAGGDNDTVFASPLPAVAPDTYASSFGPSGIGPYAAFGPFSRESMTVGGGTVAMAVVRGLDGDAAALRTWVLTAARAVTAYYGRLPVPRVLVLVVEKRAGVHGKQMGDGDASVLLQVAPGSDLHDPSWDWMATHEMVHLANPGLSRRHLWLEEGLATYVEPLARASVGDMTPEIVWREMVRGMPHGEPAAGEHGLDHTATWGSTYWGGALFCLEADLAIRRATGGAQSLQTALRAVLEAGGDARTRWPIERLLSVADAAVGQPVLRQLYQTMALSRHEVDLPRLWSTLGVVPGRRGISFDDSAPEAALRREIAGPRPHATE